MNPDTSFAVATAPRRDSKHWKQGTVTWQELTDWVRVPDDKKEAGNYLLGTLRRTKACQTCEDAGKELCLTRSSAAVVSRSAIALDVDTPPEHFIDVVEMVWDNALIIHTTFSSSAKQPKYRILIPTDRPMTPDEYVIACRAAMQKLGNEGFDPSTDQPARYMFRPATADPATYEYRVIDSDPVAVDDLLGDFDPDLSTLPMPKPSRFKRDPFAIEGVVGAFNRAYRDWDDLIASYDLPYEPAGDRRWALIGAMGAAGMGEVTDGLVYSHHVSDPAYDETCSAFDLVRLHAYGELDADVKPNTPVNKRPSHLAMLETATLDPRVTAEIAGIDFDALPDSGDEDEVDASDAWKLDLRFTSKGRLLDVVGNWELIIKHDKVFQSLRHNEFTFAAETSLEDLPWRTTEGGRAAITRNDLQPFAFYVEKQYKLRPSNTFMDGLIQTAVANRFYNPVKDYLDSLEWDGVARLEESLPGVRATPYTRMVARKALVAAVARIYEPGCKWDHTLVLYGDEGLGKTYWVDKMARGYHGQLGPTTDKDTLITMQRSWIMTSDESHSLRKSDADHQKEFLTRTVDVFRMPYDREAQAHPRHCVIWGTTNDEVFLRRQAGNRRFLIVACEEKLDFDRMTDHYVDQVWAEAVHYYRKGELLFLTDTEVALAGDEREHFVEEDALTGMIVAYLDRPVPDTWDSMSRDERTWWVQHPDPEMGTRSIDAVCSTQIWYEALGEQRAPRRNELRDIVDSLNRLPGWSRKNGTHRLPPYGPQRVFVRLDNSEEDYSDLI